MRGQTLVEFALVFPLFLFIFLAILEFAFIFNATLAVNFATRNASLLAAEAGANAWGDCVILQSLETDLGPPLDRTQIRSVWIFKADRSGNPVSPAAQMVYDRTGSTSCTLPGNVTVTVPYSLSTGTPSYNTYQPSSRCNQLGGCQVGATWVPLDSIGISTTYRYRYHTPLTNLLRALPGAGSGFFDVTWSNVMRMEPIL